MNDPALADQEIQSRLGELNENLDQPWQLIDGKLHKTFEFKNFIQAMGFMTQAAIHAQKMNHHPEWCNVYKTVEVNLVTHHSEGITDLDFELAGKMQSVVVEWNTNSRNNR